MMREQWEKLRSKIDSLSLRERVLIFSAAAFLLVALINGVMLDPLFGQQKRMSDQLVQQQEKIKEIHAQIEALLQAKKSEESSPQRQRLKQLRQRLAEGEAYVRGRKDRLVQADRIAGLLEQVLSRNGRLQLVKLQTLPVTPLVEEADSKNAGRTDVADGRTDAGPEAAGKQIFKHGVRITVRGSYPDMLEYLVALERLPSRMFWGMAQMTVVKYPVAELTLTVYTLSLDKTWLRV